MKDYTVKIPIAGFVEVSIQALDKKQAIIKGLKLADSIISEFTIPKKHVFDVNEWDLNTYEKISEGNFFYAPISQIETEAF